MWEDMTWEWRTPECNVACTCRHIRLTSASRGWPDSTHATSVIRESPRVSSRRLIATYLLLINWTPSLKNIGTPQMRGPVMSFSSGIRSSIRIFRWEASKSCSKFQNWGHVSGQCQRKGENRVSWGDGPCRQQNEIWAENSLKYSQTSGEGSVWKIQVNSGLGPRPDCLTNLDVSFHICFAVES